MIDILTDFQCQIVFLENCITDANEAIDDENYDKAIEELRTAAYQANEIQKALLRSITQVKKLKKGK